MEGQDDTHGCVVDGAWGPTLGKERVRARAPKGQARHVGPRELGLGAAGPLSSTLPPHFRTVSLPHVNSTLLCPSSFLSLSLCLYFFYYLFIIFLFLLASVKVTLFLLFTIKGQFSHFNSQKTFHTLFSFWGFFLKIKICFR